MSPAAGAAAGGTAVTIAGTGFRAGASVFFGSAAASSLSLSGTTQIAAVTPAGPPGPATVTVSNPDGGVATLSGGFVYVGPPYLSAVSPASGPRTGGTVVTVSGSGFLAGATIVFGATAGTVLSASGPVLVARTPPGLAGPASAAVTNPDGQSHTLPAAYLYTRVLSLASLFPERGPASGGVAVTVTGLDFVSGTTVSVGGAAASAVSIVSTTTLTAVAPAGAPGPAAVTLTSPDGQARTLEAGFVFVGTAPSVASVSPGGGPPWGGTAVTISGADFAPGAFVAFGGAAASSVAFVSTTQLLAVAPPGPPGATVVVAVTNPDGLGAAASGGFSYSTPADTTPPSFGGAASAVAVSPFAAVLRWSAGTDAVSPASALRYAVYGATTSGGQVFARPWAAADPGASVTLVGGLDPSRTYYFVVRARDDSGNEDSNTAEVTATTPGAPAPGWTALPAPGTPREDPVAALLPDGRILLAGGGGAGGPLATAETYDPRSGAWLPTGPMGTPRERAAAAALPDGRWLVVGGENAAGRLASCERYDPAGGAWSAVAALASARAGAVAVRLADGRVLACGGTGASGWALASAEVYDPATGTWTATGAMASGRDRHAAVLLSDGRAIVAGGAGGTGGGSALAGAELYDGAAGTWTATGSLATARSRHTATLLPDGRVLAAGGHTGSAATATCEVYDPATGTWSASGSFATARFDHRATLLARGRVLAAGGTDGTSFLAAAESYDPLAGTWTAAGTLASGRARHAAALTSGGRVVVAGGAGPSGPVAGAEGHDPRNGAGTFRPTGSPVAPRYRPLTALLPDGRVLAMGGLRWPDPGGNYVYHATAEIYDPAAGTWTATASPASARYDGVAILLGSGRVLVAGGTSRFTVSGATTPTSVESYDPIAATWASAGALALGREDPVAALLPDGRVLVAAGRSAIGSTLSSAETYDPTVGTWAWAGSMATARVAALAAALPSGKLLVVCGVTSATTLAVTGSAEARDPQTGGFSAAGSLATGRWAAIAATLPSGGTLVAGGHGATAPLSSCEIRDPASGVFSATGNLASARMDPAAALLPDGDLLVAGGMAVWSGTLPPLATAEVYDPGAGSWTGTGAMAAGRHAHALTVLADGSVLAVGGRSDVTTAELYDEGRGFASGWRPVIATVAGSAAFPVTVPRGTAIVCGGWRLGGGEAPVVELDGPIGGTGGITDHGDGRRIALSLWRATGTSVGVVTPAAGTAPPGYYRLRVTSARGVPSEARIVRLP